MLYNIIGHKVFSVVRYLGAVAPKRSNLGWTEPSSSWKGDMKSHFVASTWTLFNWWWYNWTAMVIAWTMLIGYMRGHHQCDKVFAGWRWTTGL